MNLINLYFRENYLQHVPRGKGIIGLLYRHGDKVNDKSIPDSEIPLTPEGFCQAKTATQAFLYFLGKDRIANVSEVEGSDRIRTIQTAETISTSLGANNKGKAVKELGFEDTQLGKSEFGKKMLTAFKASRLVEYMVNESDADKLADTGDTITYSYSQTASNVATFLKTKLDKFVDGIEIPDLQLALAGTHQSIVECFLAKLITLTKGKQETDIFIEAIGKQGSSFVEGIKYSISKNPKSGEVKFLIMYKKPYITQENGRSITKMFSFYEYVTPELLDLIISDRDGAATRSILESGKTVYDKPKNMESDIATKIQEDLRELASHANEFKTADQSVNYMSGVESINPVFANKIMAGVKNVLRIWNPEESFNINNINSFTDFDSLSTGDRWWFKQQAGKALQQSLEGEIFTNNQ